MTIFSVPLHWEARIHVDGPNWRRRWLSRSNRSLAAAPRSEHGDRDDINPMRCGGAKSFVDDLVFGRGVVLSRAATSLRSIETQPWTRRFVCFQDRHIFSWPGRTCPVPLRTVFHPARAARVHRASVFGPARPPRCWASVFGHQLFLSWWLSGGSGVGSGVVERRLGARAAAGRSLRKGNRA